MSHYQKLLSQIAVNESAVDCSRCQIDWKCCTYRPFIANFLLSPSTAAAVFTEELFAEWDFLIVGLSPGIQYRKNFLKKGKWGFGTDATLLCSFYNSSTGGCQIWQARPAVCRTFFCKSTYFENGLTYWKKAEEFTWMLEWVLLEDFLHHKGWTLEDVKTVKEYLREDTVLGGQALSQEFRLGSLSEARLFYQEAADYVKNLSEGATEELLQTRGINLHKELLADKVKLR